MVPTPTSAPALDSDGDGFADEYERINGSDPFNPQSVPLRALDLDGDGKITLMDAIIFYRNRIGQIRVIPQSQ